MQNELIKKCYEIAQFYLAITIILEIKFTWSTEVVTPSSSETWNNKSTFDFAKGIILSLSVLAFEQSSITGKISIRFLPTCLTFF